MPRGSYQPDVSHAEHINLKRLVSLIVLLLVLYVVLPQFHDFHSSLNTIRNAHLIWVLAAVGAMALSYPISALTFMFLSKHKLSYYRTVLVKLAGSFTNRLLPAGIGAMGISYDYLHKNKHNPAQSIAVVAANNTIGLIGHLIILATALLVAHQSVAKLFHFNFHISSYWVAFICLIILIVAVIWIKLTGKNFYQKIIQILKNLGSYQTHPLRLVGALVTSILLTLTSVLCLIACLEAIGLQLSFIKVLIVLTLGIAGGTVVPTPGGLGGAEAGMVAGFISYGLKGNLALAVTLLYRLLTYWVTLMVGAAVFSLSRRLKYI